MTMQFTPLGDNMAIAVQGCDLRVADTATAETLNHSLLENLVLCIRGQALDLREFRDAMLAFGEPLLPFESAHPEVREVNIISHEHRDKTGKPAGFNWHTDQSFRDKPSALTMLYGVEIPATGGDTQFANMYAAYDDLSDDMKQRLDGMKVVHRYRPSRQGVTGRQLTADEEKALPEVLHPIVRTHPETGRRALYLNRNRMDRIPGLEHEACEALLDELVDHATQPKYQYRHKWQPGDVVIWDNRCTMHKANGDYPQGARRVMHRMTTVGTAPF
ncbi:MAG TPA: TauD/TfdA family dioxygenase [Acetobacteraceae bacterium]|nr:TauD/TfdA family dioxygenase [Acetobacteraceae bacterium]